MMTLGLCQRVVLFQCRQVDSEAWAKMIICAVSDLHGQLPDIPKCDLLLIAGDVCPVTNHSLDFQEHWLDTEFRWWLKKIPAKKICMCRESR